METKAKARFKTKDIPISELYRNTLNFYSVTDIEELAKNIKAYGLKQNLEVVHDPTEKGEYRIIAGERRWEALKLLSGEGLKEFEIATCKLTSPANAEEEQVEVILANAYRHKSLFEMLEEEKRLKEALNALKAAGHQINGIDLSQGRIRDVISDMMNVSKTKIAQIESVNHNLIDAFKEALKNEQITFSAAYELSGMNPEEQERLFDDFMKLGEMTHKAIKEIKEKSIVSDSDTDKLSDAAGPEEYPEEIEQEEPKTKQAAGQKREKTESELYDEEQRRIDKQTKKKLEEMEAEKKLDEYFDGKDEADHDIKLASLFFDDVAQGIKTFELRKDDRHYKVGDILLMREVEGGKYTGRRLRARITWKLDEYAGLEEGYCVLSIKVLKEGKGEDER